MSRRRRKGVNNDDQYKDLFEERGVEHIRQYRTKTLKTIPEYVSTFEYVWVYGDTFWAIAQRFFNDKKYWYIIAQINNKPTESHVSIGEKIKIPHDIYEAIQVLR